jgi:hypothetical protein
MAASLDIPISEQHVFLDHAKQFEWTDVKWCVAANPALVGVQPCGRWSALHQAAHGGSVDAIQFLVRSNAALDAKTNDGKTPLDVAKTADAKAILRKLVAGQADEDDPPKTPTLPKTPRGSKVKKATKVFSPMKAKKLTKPRKKIVAKGKRGKTAVYRGRFVRTVGGLRKEQLTKSKSGKIVSKRMQAIGKGRGCSNIKGWTEAFMKARAELGLCGFIVVKKGSALYCKTMELYRS